MILPSIQLISGLVNIFSTNIWEKMFLVANNLQIMKKDPSFILIPLSVLLSAWWIIVWPFVWKESSIWSSKRKRLRSKWKMKVISTLKKFTSRNRATSFALWIPSLKNDIYALSFPSSSLWMLTWLLTIFSRYIKVLKIKNIQTYHLAEAWPLFLIWSNSLVLDANASLQTLHLFGFDFAAFSCSAFFAFFCFALFSLSYCFCLSSSSSSDYSDSATTGFFLFSTFFGGYGFDSTGCFEVCLAFWRLFRREFIKASSSSL